VSPICLGTMTFGTQTPDEKVAFEIMDKAYDRGVNFYDTAELYPVPPSGKLAGITEEIVGRWLKTKPRDSVILATKVAGAASGWFVPPIRHGLTAIDSFHIERAIEGSLKRLGLRLFPLRLLYHLLLVLWVLYLESLHPLLYVSPSSLYLSHEDRR